MKERWTKKIRKEDGKIERREDGQNYKKDRKK